MALSEESLLLALEVTSLNPDSPQAQAAEPDVLSAATESYPWSAGPGVVGLGVGAKIVGGKPTGNLALKVYVERKLPEDNVTVGMVPKTVNIPGLSEPVVTDVEPIGRLMLESSTIRIRPLRLGCSIGLLGGKTGTLGCFVQKISNPDTPLILSNSHILAQCGTAGAGSAIIQPGGDDGGNSADEVAVLEDSPAFDYNPGFNNLYDAATARVTDPQFINSADIAALSVVEPKLPKPEMLVQKSGRTTGFTVGVVRDIHFRTTVIYPKSGGGYGVVGFREQVLCTKYTENGDSGSLVCDDTGAPVGLHWCGSAAASIFSPITPLLNDLSLSVLL